MYFFDCVKSIIAEAASGGGAFETYGAQMNKKCARDKRKTPPLQNPQGWATQKRFSELRPGHPPGATKTKDARGGSARPGLKPGEEGADVSQRLKTLLP